MTSDDPSVSMSAKVAPSPTSPTAASVGRSLRFSISRAGENADDEVDPSKQEAARKEDKKEEEESVPFFSLFRSVGHH
jgi:ribosomal protein L12E/L44/L45/RPP1/RPP2